MATKFFSSGLSKTFFKQFIFWWRSSKLSGKRTTGIIALVFAAIFTLAGTVHADWTMQSPDLTPNTFKSVNVFDSDTIYAVGYSGTIVKWNGTNWTALTDMQSDATMNGVWVVSSSQVYVVGSGGTIFKYDGTSTWTKMDSGTTQIINDVWAAAANKIYAVGENGTLLFNDGSSNSWTAMTSPGTNYDYNAVFGNSATDMYAVADSDHVVQYDGTDWTEMTGSGGSHLYDVWCDATDNIWVVDSAGYAFNWTGSAWTAYDVDGALTYSLYSITGFPFSTTLIAVGRTGKIYKWNGAAWSELTSNTTRYLYGVSGDTANNIYAVGVAGEIHKSTDVTTWTKQNTGINSSLYAIWGSSASDIYVAGLSGSLYRSTDSGANWGALTSGHGASSIYAVWGVDANNVYTTGDSGKVYRSVDNGANWILQDTTGFAVTVYGIWGSAANDVYIVGVNGNIYRSTDSANFTAQTSNSGGYSLYAIWGSGAADIYAVGALGTIVHTTDSGTTWTAQTSGTTDALNAVWGSGANDIWAAGSSGVLLHTTDNGTTWTTIDTGETSALNEIWGSSSTDIYIAAASGKIIHYDGTSATTMSNLTANAFRSVWGSSATDVYFVGDYGTIFNWDGMDAVAPTTTPSPEGGALTYFDSSQSVTLGCYDHRGSGCAATYYTDDGSTPTTDSAEFPYSLSISTPTTLNFFSVDGKGNSETVVTKAFNVDSADPVTTADPDTGYYTTNTSIFDDAVPLTVTLNCVDDGGVGCDKTYYTADGTIPTTASTEYTVALVISDSTLKFLSTDLAGNEEYRTSASYTSDNSNPTTSADVDTGVYGSAQTVTLTCDDSTGSGCSVTYYTLDGTDPIDVTTLEAGASTYSASIEITEDTDLKAVSVDLVGNIASTISKSYDIDTEAPVTTITPEGGELPVDSVVSLYCSDTGGSYCGNTYYTTDGTTPDISSDYFLNSKTFTISEAMTLSYFSVDRVENMEAVQTQTYTITVDDGTDDPGPVAGGGGGGGDGGGDDGGGCFVATAAYGSYLDSHVMVLREFRDNILLTNSAGTKFVELYYEYSPPIADVIAGNKVLKIATRVALTPLVFGLEYPMHAGIIFLLLGSSAGVFAFTRRVRES